MNADSTRFPTTAKTALAIGVLLVLAAGLWWLLTSPKSVSPSALESPEEPDPLGNAETIETDSPIQYLLQEESDPLQPKPLRPETNTEFIPTGISTMTEGIELDSTFLQKLELIVTSSSTNYKERSTAVHALGNHLSEHEIDGLYRYLLAPPPLEEKKQIYDRAVKNDVLNLLRNQFEPPEGLTDTMVALFEDQTQDEAVRDYALQHLGLWHDEVSANQREVMIKTLIQGLDETERSTAGTSLLGLLNIHERGEGSVGLERIRGWSLAIALDPETGVMSKATALQVSTRLETREIVPVALQLASNRSTPYPLRVAAISAIGQLGDSDALSILDRIEEENDSNLGNALVRARQSLARFNGVEEFK